MKVLGCISIVLAHVLASSAQDIPASPTPLHGPTSSERRYADLLALATAEFGTLTDAEKKLFKAAAEGTLADYTSGDKEVDDPANADNWGPDRTLQADRIAWLCTDPDASKLITHRGIRLKDARIDCKLDLRCAAIPVPLYIEQCMFQEVLCLQEATAEALYLTGTHTPGILARGARFERGVYMRCGFQARGEVSFVGARIGGSLECDGGQFRNANGVALNADLLKVNGDVNLRNGFRAQGEVLLLRATIGGSLQCDGGNFSSQGGLALDANLARVGGDVFLSEGFTAKGEVNLARATIVGALVCDGGEFSNRKGVALDANTLNVGRAVALRSGFSAHGRIDFRRATIGGYFQCFGVTSPETLQLDLRLARIGTLWDEKRSWPHPGHLLLDGATYSDLGELVPTDAETRLEWLRLQPRDQFHPQPYEQLASVLRKSGHEEEAKKILIGKAEDQAEFLSSPLANEARLRPPFDHRWWWYKVFGPIIGYGHQPWRAGWWAIWIVALGWLFFWLGARGDVMTPTKVATYAVEETGQQKKVAEDYANYSSLMYSIDTFVPIVDLRVASYYLPNANRGGNVLGWIPRMSLTLTTGSLLRLWLWFQIAAGWILTTLFVVGLTGLVRR